MSDFKIPSEPKFPEEELEEIKEEVVEEIKLYSEEEKNEFWQCMLEDKPFVSVTEVEGVSISFRTKTANDVEQFTELSDVLRKKHSGLGDMAVQLKLGNLFLAYSLHGFRGEDFSKTPLKDRFNFVEKLQVPLNRILNKKLEKFHEKVDALLEALTGGNF